MTDLVPTGPRPVAVPGKTVALDEHVTLIDRLQKAKEAQLYWTNEIATLRNTLLDLMGDAEFATLNGKPVLSAKPIDSFNEGQFKKDNPDLHHLYQHTVEVTQLDLELLRRARPDVWAQYQVRPLKRLS